MTAPKKALTSATVSTLVKDSVEVVDSTPITSTVSLLVVDAETQLTIAHETAEAIAEVGYLSSRNSRARQLMFDAVIKLRRTFPATPQIRAILGDDAADLRGQTPEYTSAVSKVYDEAREIVLRKLKREIGADSARKVAKAEIDTLRGNISNDIRRELESSAKATKDPALFMLGHGFERNSAMGKNQAIPEGAKLELTTGEDGVVTGASVVLPKPLAAPKPDAGGTPPTETGEQLITALAKELGTQTSNPKGNVNVGVGALRSILATDPKGKVTGLTPGALALDPADRVNLAKLISQVAFETITALGESLPETERFSVAKDAESALSAIVFRLNGGKSTRSVPTGDKTVPVSASK